MTNVAMYLEAISSVETSTFLSMVLLPYLMYTGGVMGAFYLVFADELSRYLGSKLWEHRASHNHFVVPSYMDSWPTWDEAQAIEEARIQAELEEELAAYSDNYVRFMHMDTPIMSSTSSSSNWEDDSDDDDLDNVWNAFVASRPANQIIVTNHIRA